MLANFGKEDEARAFLERTYAVSSGDWKGLLRRLPAVGLLAEEVADRGHGADRPRRVTIALELAPYVAHV